MRCKHLGYRHQDGGVAVVATGVHDTGFLTCPHRACARYEWRSFRLYDRERIHVGAQGNDRAVACAATQGADNASYRDPLANIEAKPFEVIGDNGRRANLLVPKFRVLMNVTAPADHARLDIVSSGIK